MPRLHGEGNVRVDRLVLVSIILFGIIATASAIPPLPAEFYGGISIGGSPAPAGTVITARINGEVWGSIVTTAPGVYGGSGRYDPRLAVVPNESVLASTGTPTITFFVNGVEAVPTTVFSAGSSQLFNLSAPMGAITPIPAIISGGGGGGGGGFGGHVVPISGTIQGSPSPGQEGTEPDSGSQVTETLSIHSSDGLAHIEIGNGTNARAPVGTTLDQLELAGLPPSDIPAMSDSLRPAFTGIAYECKPDGFIFDPPVTLTFTIPDDVWAQQSDHPLTVRWFNPATGSWEDLSTTIDSAHRRLSVQVMHLSIFGVFWVTGESYQAESAVTPEITITGENQIPIPLLASPVLVTGGVIIALIMVISFWHIDRKNG